MEKGLRIYKSNKDAAIKGLAQFMQLKDSAALEETWEGSRAPIQGCSISRG